ncbi:hypothetical protein J3R80_11925 [Aliiroseovarius sp. Z3]|nr:hypothetical protein [Aliiroseovarius sp. Z3]
MGFASPAWAEREVHVVAVGKGQQPDDYYALPEAHVLVDRPGQEIGLVLLDGGVLRWRIEATDGTIITEIIRSGPGIRDSEVLLSGIPVTGVQVSGLPLVFSPWGRDFRTLIDSVADRMKTERIHSFSGAHQFHDRLLRVDQVDTETAGLARDYLSEQLGTSDDLPAKLRRWLANGEGGGGYSVDFDQTGISLTSPAGTQRFPVSPDVPDIVLPVAGVYAPDEQTIYGLTYGADGYLYSVDVRTGRWDVVTSLHEYDAAGLLYDADTRLLITTGAFSRPGEIRTFGLDGSHSSTFIPTTDFPGLSDLFDFGNEHGPPLTPRVYADNWLLLEALGEGVSAYPDIGQYRIYAVRMDTSEVRLLRYRDE